MEPLEIEAEARDQKAFQEGFADRKANKESKFFSYRIDGSFQIMKHGRVLGIIHKMVDPEDIRYGKKYLEGYDKASK